MDTFKTEHLNPYGIIITATEPTLAEMMQLPINDLIDVHKVVILRGFPTLNLDQLQHFAEQSGEILKWDFGAVMELKVDPHAKNYLFTTDQVPYHWDGAFHREPRLLFFQCLQAPDQDAGGATYFANTETIWQQATAQEQMDWRTREIDYATEKLAHYGGTISKTLVAQHPKTEKTILRFAEPVKAPQLNPVTVQVEGMDEPSSGTYLQDLFKRAYHPKVLLKHQWQHNDYLIADNYSLLHGRERFLKDQPRHIRRIQVL